MGFLAQVRQARAPLCRGGRSAAWLHDVPDQGCRCTTCRTKLAVLENVWLGWDAAGGAEPRKKRAQALAIPRSLPPSHSPSPLPSLLPLPSSSPVPKPEPEPEPHHPHPALFPTPTPTQGVRQPCLSARLDCADAAGALAHLTPSDRGYGLAIHAEGGNGGDGGGSSRSSDGGGGGGNWSGCGGGARVGETTLLVVSPRREFFSNLWHCVVELVALLQTAHVLGEPLNEMRLLVADTRRGEAEAARQCPDKTLTRPQPRPDPNCDSAPAH